MEDELEETECLLQDTLDNMSRLQIKESTLISEGNYL